MLRVRTAVKEQTFCRGTRLMMRSMPFEARAGTSRSPCTGHCMDILCQVHAPSAQICLQMRGLEDTPRLRYTAS